MNINLLPYAAFWAVLAVVVIVMIMYRKSVASHEDDSIHLEGSGATQQVSLAHKLALIDRWGKTLTIVTVLYGVGLAAVYMYHVWNNVPTY